MADESSLISEFKSITQENDERSRFFLESADWQLPVALGNFYDSMASSSLEDTGAMAPQDPPVRYSSSEMDVDDQDVTSADSLTKVRSLFQVILTGRLAEILLDYIIYLI